MKQTSSSGIVYIIPNHMRAADLVLTSIVEAIINLLYIYSIWPFLIKVGPDHGGGIGISPSPCLMLNIIAG